MAFGVQFEHQRWREDAKPKSVAPQGTAQNEKPGGAPAQNEKPLTDDVFVVRGFWRDANDVLWTHTVERRFPTDDVEKGAIVVGQLIAELQAEVVKLILETQQQLQVVPNAAR